MANSSLDLISMADIARLAGEKPATVGNWKARNPDEFPRERGRGSRGPLYDRVEVMVWLEATKRLKAGAPELAMMWNLVDSFRGALDTEDVVAMLLALLALKSKAPEEWSRLQSASDSSHIGDTFRAALHSAFPAISEHLPVGRVPDRPLHDAVAALVNTEDTHLGEMVDALFKRTATAIGRHGGEFLTPRSVRRLMAAICEPEGVVYNPATGVGQLMIDAALDATIQPIRLVGQEINGRAWAMAQLNLAIHDLEAEIALGDVFGEDHFPQLCADRVLCAPPWNVKLPIAGALFDDPRWIYGEPGANDGNVAWIQHCLAHLADDGRAVIVLPNSAMFQSGRAGRIRQRIVKAGLLDAVFALPAGLFASTALPCSLLVFSKGRRGDGRPLTTLMVDVTELQQPQGTRGSNLSDELIVDLAHLYRDWLNGQQPTVGYAAVATFDDLANNEFVIDPVRYLSLPRSTRDVASAARARAELVDRLGSLARASREADAHVQTLLGEPQ